MDRRLTERLVEFPAARRVLVSRAVFTGRKFVYLCCCHRSMSSGHRVKYFLAAVQVRNGLK